VPATIEYTTGIDSNLLEQINQGGEGRIFEFVNDQATIYKEFFFSSRHPPNLRALQQLITVMESCSEKERMYIESRTVWPRVAVTDRGRLRGYLMKRVPAQFFRLYGLRNRPRNILCDWNYLSMRDRYENNPRLLSEIPKPNAAQISALIADLARTVQELHRHDVIVGDMSGQNLIWTDQPSLHVMLIDCDSFRVRGSAGVNYPKETPDWEDPVVQQGRTNQQSDIYKLGVAAYRAVWAATTHLPPRDLADRPPPVGVPAALPSLIARSTGTGDRPSAAEWVQGLAEPSAAASAPATPSQTTLLAGKRSTPASPQRPTIRMRPNSPGD